MIDIPCYTQESVESVFQMNDSMLHMFCEQIVNNFIAQAFCALLFDFVCW